jgi:catechol 2,3-dioxygenase-like lactoylglutathione lyase family enzyme
MKVTRILHTSVSVEGRLDSATDFYRTLLGLADEARPDFPGVGGHWFAVGDAQVHLVDAPGGSGAIRPTDHHVCFGVDDLDAAITELEANGIEYLRAAQGDVVQVWVADPAGNTIELQQDPATS